MFTLGFYRVALLTWKLLISFMIIMKNKFFWYSLQKRQLHWDVPSSIFPTTEPVALSLVRIDISADDVMDSLLLSSKMTLSSSLSFSLYTKSSIEGRTVTREQDQKKKTAQKLVKKYMILTLETSLFNSLFKSL